MEVPTRGPQVAKRGHSNHSEDGRRLQEVPNQQGWMWIDTQVNGNYRPVRYTLWRKYRFDCSSTVGCQDLSFLQTTLH